MRPSHPAAGCGTPPLKESLALKKFLAEIAATLQRDDFGTGPLASLRRHDPAIVAGQPAFHRLITRLPDERVKDPASILRWATVVHAMAIGIRPGVNEPGCEIGTAFARAGLSEARLSRLLAARDAAFRDQVILAVRFLRAKNIPFRWDTLGELILVEDRDETRAATLRFFIARKYYQELDAKSDISDDEPEDDEVKDEVS